MNPTEVALVALIAFALPIGGIGILIIRWQLELEAEERSRSKPGIKAAE